MPHKIYRTNPLSQWVKMAPKWAIDDLSRRTNVSRVYLNHLASGRRENPKIRLALSLALAIYDLNTEINLSSGVLMPPVTLLDLAANTRRDYELPKGLNNIMKASK